MRNRRFPIAGLLAVLTVAVLDLMALRIASPYWEGLAFLLTCGAFCLALVGIVCRQHEKRLWWLGFALFGCGYLIVAHWSMLELPTTSVLTSLEMRLHHRQPDVSFGWPSGSFARIGHDVCRTLRSTRGWSARPLLFQRPSRTHTPGRYPGTARGSPTAALVALADGRPAVVTGLILIASSGSSPARSPGDSWAGGVFFATCLVLATIVLGAASSQTKHRRVWRGAALFGAGYMVLMFCRPMDDYSSLGLPTDQLLAAAHRWFPGVVAGRAQGSPSIVAENQRILGALSSRFPCIFPNTPRSKTSSAPSAT